MNEQLVLDNYLLVLKSTVEVYVHGTLESSNANCRNTLKDCLLETLTSQANTYDLMKECGFYSVENVDSSSILQTLSSINS